ncbi:hypothetical protein NDA14_000754 [Ustilago hordei]|nr:hypothetical protein NDA14_000754 [Ustilago hordei]
MDTMMSMAAPPVLQGSSGYYTWQRQLRIYVNGVNPMMWEEITGTAYFHENQLKLHWNDKHAGEPNHQQAEDHACIVNLVATNQDMFRERNAKTKEENAKAHHNTPSSQGVNSKSHEQSKVRKELERGPDEELGTININVMMTPRSGVSVDDDEVDGVGDEIGDVDDNEVDGVGDKVGGVNTSVQCVDLMLEVIPGPQWTTAFGSIYIRTANLLWAPSDVR